MRQPNLAQAILTAAAMNWYRWTYSLKELGMQPLVYPAENLRGNTEMAAGGRRNYWSRKLITSFAGTWIGRGGLDGVRITQYR